jgi:hypothetical protein
VIGFYLDEDLSPTIARMARDVGLNVTSCHELGMQKRTDAEQLAFSTAQGRCLVTGNGRDYEPISHERYLNGEPHAGVAAVPGTWRRSDYARIVRALVALSELYPDGPADYMFVYLREPA